MKHSFFQIRKGVWLDQDSPLIFHVGFAQKVGYEINAKEDYLKHGKKIADALKAVCFLDFEISVKVCVYFIHSPPIFF